MRTHTCTDVICCLIVVILVVLSTFGRAENDNATYLRPCDISNSNSACGKNQRCRMMTNSSPICDCILQYHPVNGECVMTTPTVITETTTLKPEYRPESEKGSSVAAGLLIPTFLIVAGVLLYFGARRYKWLQRFRQYRHNRYGNVLVTRDDDDDDDPPIA